MLSGEVRIRFSKTGKVKYISHLDLCRTFRTAFVRAGIPIWYSQGFNPHPKMVFATTVAVGHESFCELLDIKITSPMDEEELRDRLDKQLTKDISIIKVYEPHREFAELKYVGYEMTLESEVDADKLSGLLGGPLPVEKKTKSGNKIVDVSGKIKEVKAEGNRLTCVLAAAQSDTLGPDVFLRAIAPALPDALPVSVVRTNLYDEQGNEFE